jgi:GrpB-like predicted nucleotidyltransferase (UPF0157 family)
VIEIVDYQARWPSEFKSVASRLRQTLGSSALRIDHIGSTAVPALAAKDVIDIQITVADFSDALERLMTNAGFARQDWTRDHLPPGATLPESELEKRAFTSPAGERRANIHVRVNGRFNQRYALLCRDYLRAHPPAARAYGEVKRALAAIVGDDLDAFYAVKDPVVDIIMAGAEEWASRTEWKPGPSDG